jgi:hypothetical protein
MIWRKFAIVVLAILGDVALGWYVTSPRECDTDAQCAATPPCVLTPGCDGSPYREPYPWLP